MNSAIEFISSNAWFKVLKLNMIKVRSNVVRSLIIYGSTIAWFYYEAELIVFR